MKKYELIKEDCIDIGVRKLYRIRALRDFRNVKAGDIGGYIEDERNLSHEGNSWVYDEAKVYGNALVCGDAILRDCAMVGGFTKACDHAVVGDYASVRDYARIGGHTLVTGYDVVKG